MNYALVPNTSRSSSYLDSYETAGYAPSGNKGSGLAAGVDNQFSNADWMADSWAKGSPGDLRKWASRSAGATGGGRPTSTRSVTRTVRSGSAPDLPELPTYQAPEYNKRAARATAQKLAAPGIRTLRQTVQEAMGRNFENPNFRKMTLREALQGYGVGLENVMAGASREARSDQMAELQLQQKEAQNNWEAQTKAAMSAYQNAWNDYMKGTETVSETQPMENTFKIGNRDYTTDPISGRPVPVY